MVNNEIWLDSHANVGIIPEQDIYLGAFKSPIADSGNQKVITLNDSFTANFALLTNLYRGCMLDIYAVSDNALIDRTMIQSNTATTITVADSLDTLITDTPTAYYGVIHHYGAPVPALKGASAGSVYTQQVLTVQFKSDTKGDYDNVGIIFGVLDGNGGTERDVGIFFTSDGTFDNLASLLTDTDYDIEVDISNAQLTTAEEYIDAAIAAINLVDTDEGDADSLSDFTAVRSGSSLILTNVYGGTVSRTPGTDDGGADSTISSLDTASTSIIELTETIPGATNTSNNPRLLADNWPGLATSITIPATSVEAKQINVGIGGTRNFTYQFKGTETTSEFGLDAMANSFPWLYYALGTKSISSLDSTAKIDQTPSNTWQTSSDISAGANRFWRTNAGDRLIRAKNPEASTSPGIFCPPILPTEVLAGELINEDDAANDLITYTITENESSDLPSFAVEYSLRKPDVVFTAGTSASTDTNKEQVYAKIYPGCTVNNLTLTAAVGQEVTCNISAMPKTTFVAPVNYDIQNGIPDVADFINFGTRDGEDSSTAINEPLMRPFFFSDGTIKLFEQEFIQLENITLSIDNAIQQKRFVGAYDKNSQFAFAGQRTYNLNFTGLVTDAKLFDYFRREHAFSLSGTDDAVIDLLFEKDNGESLRMKFKDYHVTSAEFPLTNDNGPLVVTWTVVPLALQSCVLTTYWAIQG